MTSFPSAAVLSRTMAEPAERRDPTAVYVAGILAKAPPMSRQQRDRLQVLLGHIHSARQQLRTGNTGSMESPGSRGKHGQRGKHGPEAGR